MTADPDWLKKNPLRRWRERQAPQGSTQEQAARLLGCSPSTIRLWEHGTAMPQQRYLDRLAELLGISSEAVERKWVKWRLDGVRPAPERQAAGVEA